MTVPTTTNKVVATGNGVSTIYPFTFGTLPSGDIVVTLYDLDGVAIPQVENSDYTVQGKGEEDGGSVTFSVAPPNDYTVLIQRIVSITQPTDYKNQGSFYPRTHERSFDRTAMIDQQQEERIDAALTLPPQITGVSTTLPIPQSLRLIGWNEASDSLRNFTVSEIGTALAFSNFIADRFTAVAAQTDFTLTADPGAIGNLDVSIDGVTQRPFDDYFYTGTTLTFVTPMVGGELVLARYGTALPTGITDSNAILYTPSSTGIIGTMKSFLDALWSTGLNAGARLVRWIQAGTGATPMTVEDELRRTVRPEQFGAVGNGVSDDAAALQLAMNHAAGGVLKGTPGRTYVITQAIKVKSNTTVDMRGCTVVRGAAIDNMIRNDADGVTGAYGANSNIAIFGGTWDGNSGAYGGTNCTIMAFGHCSSVRVQDASFLHTNAWHHLELNGCFNCEVSGCTFAGGASLVLTTNEAVQIDMNIDMSQFPWFGPADSTVCSDINVHDNTFIDVGVGCGTHSASGALRHNNTRFINNHVTGANYAGVVALNWTDSKIMNNRIERGYYGVLFTSTGTSLLRNNIISRNTFYDIGNTAQAGTASRAIFVHQASDNAHQIIGISVDGNHVLDMKTVGKSQLGISINYCQDVHVSDNVVRNILQGGIMLFQLNKLLVSNNQVSSSNVSATVSQYGIGVSGASLRGVVDGNLTDTMGIFSSDRMIVQNNNVTTAAGLSSGSNTSTTIARNLQDTTFA